MEQRLRVLELIEAGEISVEEGVRRLEVLVEVSETPVASAPAGPAASIARPALVQWLWQAVFWTGVALVAGGGLLMVSFHTRKVATRWLTWGWVLFILGVLGVLLGWWLQQAHWFSLWVRQSDGPNISFALPLPLRPITWVLRILRPLVPQLEATGIDELVLAMREEMRDGHPIMIEVDDKEDGDQVRIYLG